LRYIIGHLGNLLFLLNALGLHDQLLDLFFVEALLLLDLISSHWNSI